MKSEWNAIGLMSGTSLDGVDLAWCRFWIKDNKWQYEIKKATTVAYPEEMHTKLSVATSMSALDLMKLGNELGTFFADSINGWLENGERPDFIASHGHTIFHQPDTGLTTQIGNGAIIAAKTRIPVVCDFRSKDVALGGQGAPLVPIGDELLFSDYDACLNLGGFSNISFKQCDKRVAYDISPCNMALNDLANRAGYKYDDNGCLSRQGTIIPELRQKLNCIAYYQQKYPKSLGKEWYETCFKLIFETFLIDNLLSDVSRTVLEHIADQLANNIPDYCEKLLVTGGGANHKFLIQQLGARIPSVSIVVPDKLIVDYKEALIFAFLGLLRMEGKNNCLKSVTGATDDSCGGCVYL